MSSESSRFVALWTAAEEPFAEAVNETYPRDPMDQAFEEASALGDVAPIVELALQRPPDFVVAVLDKLNERSWTKFAKGLLVGLGERLEPPRVPALASLLRPTDDWLPSDGSIFVGAFAKVRAIREVCQVVDLMMRAGDARYASIMVKTVREERPLAEVAALFVELHKGGHGWTVGNTWNSDQVWPESPDILLLLIEEFRSLGYPQGVPDLVARYGSGHSGMHRWQLYRLLGDERMADVQEGLIRSLIEHVPEREVVDFVSAAMSDGHKDLALKVITGLVSFRKSTPLIHFLPPELAAAVKESRVGN
ncbi:hypothetical protein ACWDF1_14665 [Streptomyces coelicoflavus]|uniref:hypothetical protein n=1 Tax=Streptomyces coelicoflavus TaxID=285562 RepID=UPI0036AC3683